MTKRDLICVSCPIGCAITVELDDNNEVISVTGNTCPRGDKYARQECTLPERMITAVIPVAGSETPLSVKTSRPVPKVLIRDVMRELSRLSPVLPVAAGQVVLADVLGTGADIVATRELE